MCPCATSELAFAHISGWLQERQCRNAWTSIWELATNCTPHHCHAARSRCQLWQVPRHFMDVSMMNFDAGGTPNLIWQRGLTLTNTPAECWLFRLSLVAACCDVYWCLGCYA